MTDISKLSALLDKLGSDRDFRNRLETHPAATLGELGVSLPQGFDASGIQLPSMEEVQAKKAQWLQHAQAEPTAMAIFFFIK
jgi:putative modified peptide